MKNTNKKLIIFDFDGVISDTWEHAYQMNVFDWPDLKPEEHRNFFNGNIFEEIAKMPPSTRQPEEKNKWLEEVYFPKKLKLPLFEGIVEVIQKLSEQYEMSINTSARAEQTRKYLERHNLDKFFDKIYGKETSKDKVEKFKKIISDHGVTADETVQITDTVGDMKEAEKVGIKSIISPPACSGDSNWYPEEVKPTHLTKPHNKNLLIYHLVCPVKYRRDVFTPDVAHTLFRSREKDQKYHCTSYFQNTSRS
jgi:HAD superfamily hydrolase (TIGR01509 family)